MFRSFVFALVLVVVFAAESAATPQDSTPTPPPAAPAGGSAQQPQAVAPLPASTVGAPPAGTAPAFIIQSDDGDNRIQLGALLQIDGRLAFVDEQQNVLDNFNLRRFRTIAQGRVARHFEFFLNTEFAGGLTIRDGYRQVRWMDTWPVA